MKKRQPTAKSPQNTIDVCLSAICLLDLVLYSVYRYLMNNLFLNNRGYPRRRINGYIDATKWHLLDAYFIRLILLLLKVQAKGLRELQMMMKGFFPPLLVILSCFC